MYTVHVHAYQQHCNSVDYYMKEQVRYMCTCTLTYD